MFDTGCPDTTAAALAAADARRATTDALADLVTAAARHVAWAEAVGLAAVAELARRRRAEHLTPPPGEPATGTADEVDAFIAAEVGVLTRTSSGTARNRVALATDLVQRLPGTLQALRQGSIDLGRARRISEATGVLDRSGCQAVEDRVLARAGQQTAEQVAVACRRAVHAHDPDASTRRCAAAREARRAGTYPEADGMASLWVRGPVEAVAAAWRRVDALARAGQDRARDDRDAGPDRASVGSGRGRRPLPTLDQLRVDAVLGLLAGSSDLMTEAAGIAIQLDVVAPLGTVLGLGDEPGELPGYGPVPAEVVRALAGQATWRRFISEDGEVVGVGRTRYRPSAALVDAIRARDLTCRFPGCRRHARGCDLDHTVAFPAGPTAGDNLAALCRHHHRLKHRAGWRLIQRPGGRLIWVSPSGNGHVTEPHRWEQRRPRGPDDSSREAG